MKYTHQPTNDSHIDNVFSDTTELKYGVPQGTCAGPVLYTIYGSTLSEVFRKFDLSFMGYADDHTLYASSCLEKEAISWTIATIEGCLKEVKDWIGRNRLMVNDQKTEFIAFGRRHSLVNLSVDPIDVGDKPVGISATVKYLGV